MNVFPLIRTKWSNEHIMAALFVVLILYHIPLWSDNLGQFPAFVILTLVGLIMDAAANIIKYKRIWCCVSAAVTAAIISLLTPGIPLWKQLMGLSVALIIGKYIWGGTGKNKINPAVLGLLAIMLFSDMPESFFTSSYLLLPAILLSIPFLFIRPYAGIGFILGALMILSLNHQLSFDNLLSNGVIFWSCVVLTDPVTVTSNKWIGSVAGFAAGVAAMYFHVDSWIFITVIFIVNLLSFMLEGKLNQKQVYRAGFKIPKMFTYEESKVIDLTGEHKILEAAELGIEELSSDEIIRILKHNEVFGMGGAAYPTYKKLSSVLSSNEKSKYLIINGVECDPGLIHDDFILKHFKEELQKAIEVLNNCVGFSSMHLAVKGKEGLQFADNIKIHQVSNQYPAGAEKILINEVLNKHLDKGQIPAACGILVLNVQTLLSVYDAIFLNKPADTRFLTVANLKERTAKVVKVCIGMQLKDIVEAVYPGNMRIFAGGGVMQAYTALEEAIVDKQINFIATGMLPRYKESPQCSQCGYCSAHCPAGLPVNKIADLVDQGKLKDALKYKPSECIGCGSCSYSCLAGRNLAEKVKKVKHM